MSPHPLRTAVLLLLAGIAWDRTPGREGDLWGIIEERREVVRTRVEPLP
jgi:hypothetical protein